MKLHIDYGDEEDFSSIDSTLTDYLYVIGEVEDMVQQAMHANIDSIKPIDFKTYNKLLTSELEARNIVTEHELVTIYKPNNGDEKGWMHLDKPERFTTWKNPVHFDYPLHNESTLQYRLFLKSPASVILTQMKGILISSSYYFADHLRFHILTPHHLKAKDRGRIEDRFHQQYDA